MRRVLVTGSTGFVGRSLCPSLSEAGFLVRAVARNQSRAPEGCAEAIVVREIDSMTQWSSILEGVDAIVHLAARAHTTSGAARAAEYVELNSNATRALAAAAARMGVRKFIYLSTIKVNGSSTSGRPFRRDDEVQPDGVYGLSKWLGERYLVEASAGSLMEPVIVRPPLVYGPGVKANFLSLLKSIDKGWPLPIGAVHNARSLVSVWNLTHLIITLLQYPGSAAGTWLVSDGRDLSTPALIEMIAAAMGRRARLPELPIWALQAVGAVIRRGDAVERLCGSLAVDISATSNAFAWKPPVQVEEGVARTVAAYLRGKRP